LDCEQKLLDMAQSDDLKSQRQQSVKNFLSIREGMIQRIGSNGSSSGEDDKPGAGVSGLEAKTDGPSVQLITTANRCDKVECPTLPMGVVESFDEFRYDASELGSIRSAQSSEASYARDY
jgi:hypothetical protein